MAIMRIRTIITGATSGIGYELATQLAGAGVHVIAIGRQPERLASLAAGSTRIEPVAADLSNRDAVLNIAGMLTARYDDIDGLINNAGVQHDWRFDDSRYGPADIEEELAVNLTAPILLTHALLPVLRRHASAAIVNVTSGLGYVPKRTAAVYSASKAGLRLFTDALRVQTRDSSVRIVEAVMPLVDTPMTRGRGRGKISASDAATQLLRGVAQGHAVVRVGKARALPHLQRWAPALLHRLMQTHP